MVPKVTLAGDSNRIQLYDVLFRYAIGTAETDGALSMLEVTVPARTLIKPHMHTREDEFTLVLEGSVSARLGDEIVETMRDLRANGVDVVTIGQYLQPSQKHAVIDRWVHPDEFRWLRERGEELGFGSVFAGPLVRSSYRADEQRHAAESGRGAVAY